MAEPTNAAPSTNRIPMTNARSRRPGQKPNAKLGKTRPARMGGRSADRAAMALAVAGCEAALSHADAFGVLRLFDDSAIDPFATLDTLAEGEEGRRGAAPDPEAQARKNGCSPPRANCSKRAATNSSPPTRDAMTPNGHLA